MITIKDIQEGSHVWFAQHRYLVLEVCPRLFVAKRFRDGVTRTFPESEFKSVYLEKPHSDTVFVAVDADGSPSIYPWKPERDGHGYWHCMEEVEGEYVDMEVPISWSLMLSLVGRPMTHADEPVEIQ